MDTTSTPIAFPSSNSCASTRSPHGCCSSILLVTRAALADHARSTRLGGRLRCRAKESTWACQLLIPSAVECIRSSCRCRTARQPQRDQTRSLRHRQHELHERPLRHGRAASPGGRYDFADASELNQLLVRGRQDAVRSGGECAHGVLVRTRRQNSSDVRTGSTGLPPKSKHQQHRARTNTSAVSTLGLRPSSSSYRPAITRTE